MSRTKTITIIGGGPAGLEAASCLKSLGYQVIVIEEKPQLGGHLARWDRLFPYGNKAEDVLNDLLAKTEGVTFLTDTKVSSANRLENQFSIVVNNSKTIISDAILLTTGFDLFAAERKEEYGYGIYNQVITNADLEDWFNTGENPAINSPKRIGFVHCVGSRDEKAGCRGCSKVCCATAVKQACEIKQAFPDARVYCFYMDLRMFGRYYEDLYLKAQKEYGVRFVRGRVSEVAENADGTLQVKAEDTLSSQPLKVTLDLLVLMAGMRPAERGTRIGSLLMIGKGEDGFLNPSDGIHNTQDTSVGGIFVAGAATGPKNLPETFSEARGAAMRIHQYLTSQK